MAEGTADRVLAVARERFLRDGFEATTVRAIAADAGVATGTVLLHHGSKRQLAASVLAGALRPVVTAAADGIDAGATPLDRVVAAGAVVHRWFVADAQVLTGLLRESLLTPGHTAVEARMVLLFARVLEEDRRAGRLPEDLDVRLVAEGLAADHQHVLLQTLRSEAPGDAPAAARFRALAGTRLPG